MIPSAVAVGYNPIVLIVDTPYIGTRSGKLRNKPPSVRPANFEADTPMPLPPVDNESKLEPEKPVLHHSPNTKPKIGRLITGPLKSENS